MNHYLGLFLVVLSIHMILNFIEGQWNVQLVRLNNSLGFLYGPLIWFYVNGLIRKDRKFKQVELIHFLPFFVSVTLVYHAIGTSYIGPAIVIQTSIYLLLSIKAIISHEHALKITNARIDGVSLSWLIQFIIGISVIFAVDVYRNTIASPVYSEFLFGLLVVLFIGFINLIVFKSLNHAERFLGISEEDFETLRSKKAKYADNNLDWASLQEHADQIREFIETYKSYLDPDINLAQFAQKLNINARITSQVINVCFHTNFSDWINDYRLKYAQEQLIKNTSSEKNISQVLYESGFNSKSSFYSIFKTKTGMSPSEYRSRYS